MFDMIIVGGPTGLSAALHLAFHSRNVLVIDCRTGQLFYTRIKLWNVPGFVGSTGYKFKNS
jgi:thioredoxin reductase